MRILLTLTDCTQKIIIDLVERRIDDPGNVEAFLEL